MCFKAPLVWSLLIESALAYNGFDDVAQSSQGYQRYDHSCEFRTPFEAEIAFPTSFPYGIAEQ